MFMFLEDWEKWEPIQHLPANVTLEEFDNDEEGFLIKLSDKNNKTLITVLFDGFVMSYRNTDEGNMLKTMNLLSEKYGNDFLPKWSFFKVKNSEYLKWLHEQTYDSYVDLKVQHFVIATRDEFIEILATYEPTVSIGRIDSK